MQTVFQIPLKALTECKPPPTTASYFQLSNPNVSTGITKWILHAEKNSSMRLKKCHQNVIYIFLVLQ